MIAVMPLDAAAGPVVPQSGGVQEPVDGKAVPPTNSKLFQFGTGRRTAPIVEAPLDAYAMPEITDRGESLERVLHSMVNAQSPQRTGIQQADIGSAGAQSGDADAIDRAMEAAYRMLLDNETLGAAVRTVVQVEVGEDGRKTFELLGMGRFEIDSNPADDGSIYVTELNTGISVPLQAADAQPGQTEDVPKVEPRRGPPLNFMNLVKRIVGLLDKEEWTFVFILAGLIVIPVGALRLAMRINRRDTAAMRLVRSERQ
jgi:hypothetical protein